MSAHNAFDDTPEPSKIRKGRFLWMDEEGRHRYVRKVKERIASGYYFSNTIIGQVVDELAPAMEHALEENLS